MKDANIDSITSLLLQISKLIVQQSNISYEERASTHLQMHVLSFLEKNPKATSSDIAKYINASLSSIAQLTDRLEKAGYIERAGDANDRRIIHISLTEEGENHLKQMRKAKLERMKTLFANIDEHDEKELIRIFEKILANLKK